MKQNYCLSALFASLLLLTTACEKNEIPENDFSDQVRPKVSLTNTKGAADGVSYSLQGVSMNPDVVSISEKNARIESTKQELSAGTLKLSELSDDLSASLNAGSILYVKTDDFTALKKITGINATAGGVYSLQVEQAHLGEIFEEGTIDLSVDLYEAALAKQEKTGLRAGGLLNRFYELDFQDEYDLGAGFRYNPATNIKMSYNMKLSFVRNQILPSEFSSIFELQVAINPALNFAGSFNSIDNYELSQYIPEALLDYIKSQSFDFKIPINMLGIDSLAATLKVKDIKMPLRVEANLSNQTAFSYGLNGNYKIGYSVAIKGTTPKITPVYENNLVATNPSPSDTYGELLTSSTIDITPDISILDGAYSVDGTLSLENRTSTYGNISLPGQAPVSGSRGVNITKLIANIDLILIKIPVTVLNTEEELWNIGTIVKSVVYSDLKYTLPSSYTDDYGPLGNVVQVGSFKRTYKNTEISLNYKYQILGKKIPDELTISYDVYAENGSTKLASVQDAVIRPSDITANSFKFKQDIFFSGETTYEKTGEQKVKVGFITITVPVYGNVTRCQSKSYLKNIVIKDNNGYVYEGIYNTAKGVVETSIELKR
ncbi:hypothetical protein FACS189426_19080 [Bacteroidia bacterium]|nr:hypothetical protein FACS189426_19080 [Bacteroidia bacterium]GHT85970.1 hypothetical protein FACS18947_5370 [Bacteroidia bacterium]GHV71484.1 hypothetical protein FACS189420_6760 [Bacteroidia bacterium]